MLRSRSRLAPKVRRAIAKAEQLAKETPNSWIPQFGNQATVEIHKKTIMKKFGKTRMQCWTSCGRSGHGWNHYGLRKRLTRRPSFQAIAVDPKDSPVITQTLAGQPLKPGPHKIQGLGAGFIPKNLHLKDSSGKPQIAESIQVSNDDAFAMARRLAKEEGILCGISSGANVGSDRNRQAPGKQREKIT